MPSASRRIAATFLASALAGALAYAQRGAPAPPAAGGRAAGAAQGGRAAPVPRLDYPQREVDSTSAERGKAVYSVNCAFCHGPDARGGDGGGPNLLRSQLVLSDKKGELIGEVIRHGRPGTAMAPMALTPAQIADIAEFLHSFRVGGYDITRNAPVSIVVGDAKAGAAAFQSRCGSCHSAGGDMRGIATRYPDPRQMQDAWLMPSTAAGRGGGRGVALKPVTATVTLPSGERFEGPLVRIDDFVVTLQLPDGTPRSFARRDMTPAIVINDPLAPHRELLPKYTDAEIHDITAFLITLK